VPASSLERGSCRLTIDARPSARKRVETLLKLVNEDPQKGDARRPSVGLGAPTHMPSRGPHPATLTPQRQLPQARLVLGSAAAAFGLFVAFHWIVLPGDHVLLDQKSHRSESITARDATPRARAGRAAPAAHTAGMRAAVNGGTPGVKGKRQSTKTTPRTAGKPVGSSPTTKQPGAPAAGDPAATGSGSPGATETPADQSASSPPPPVSPPPPPPPPPAGLPQVPQLPQVPEVPVPTVPDLPKPQVPSVPTPPVPTLP
jgi:hypothetical protein